MAIQTQSDLLRLLFKRFPNWSHHFVNSPSNGGRVWCAGAIDDLAEPRCSVCEVGATLEEVIRKITERLLC